MSNFESAVNVNGNNNIHRQSPFTNMDSIAMQFGDLNISSNNMSHSTSYQASVLPVESSIAHIWRKLVSIERKYYACCYCPKDFRNRRELIIHIKKHDKKLKSHNGDRQTRHGHHPYRI